MKSCWAATNEEGRKSGIRRRDEKGMYRLVEELPGFLDCFAFSLSASLLSEYSSKLLLCCSSQDDGSVVAILH